jgi:hypothetical protein
MIKRVAVYARYAYKVYKCRKAFKEYAHQYNQKALFVAGLPKSGTTWLENILCSYPGFSNILIPESTNFELATGGSHNFELPNNVFSRFNNMLFVTKMHIQGSEHNVDVLRKAGVKYVIVYRDLRDVAISYYYYVRQTPWHPEFPVYSRLTLSEGLMEFGRQTLEDYAEWVRSWHLRRDQGMSMVIRYEDMLVDTIGVVTKVAKHLGLDSRPDTISTIVQANSFEKLSSGRKHGETDNESFFRSGISGNWKKLFTSEIKELYKQKVGDFLIEFGYEQNKSW